MHVVLDQGDARRGPYAPEELSGASVEILMPSRFRADHRSYVSAFSREEGKATRIMGRRRPLIGRKRTGEEFYIEATVTRHAMQGQAAMAVVIRDVSARRRLEQEVAAKNAAIARNEKRMQLALKAGRMGTWSWDRASAEFYYDAQTRRLLGLDLETTASASRALRRLYEEDRARLLQDMRTALSERRPFSTEVQVKTTGGKRRWVSCKGEAAEGKPSSLFGVVSEVTEAHELEELRATIWGELNHRVRNQMAVVRSLVWLTARDAESLDSYVRKLEERLQLFTDDLALPPDGQDTVLDVRDVIKAETRIYETRVFLDGPDATLSRPSAVSLRLALHELTTNAVKYGALGSPDGRLDVTWHVHVKARLRRPGLRRGSPKRR